MTQAEWRNIFAHNLKVILQCNGMTQTQLARDTGLSVSRISDYINGKATPTIFAIINMAYALDISIDELVDFSDRIEC